MRAVRYIPRTMLDLARLDAAPLVTDPFAFVTLERFVDPAQLAAVNADYPDLKGPGSHPVEHLRYGPAFAALVEALRGPALRDAIERKFGLDLAGRPTLVTARGFTQAKDGRIHTDSETKLVTLLVYLNEGWSSPDGRLRMLRSADLDDSAAEIEPGQGAMVAFPRSERALHGHTRFVGRRRSLQLNWLTSDEVYRREVARHGVSHWWKRLAG